jgi:hypothetical protein
MLSNGSSPARPDAVLDTTVSLTIYSWHDLLGANAIADGRSSNAGLMDPAVRFRAQRARTALLLTLFLDQRSWTTIGPLNELRPTLEKVASPKAPVRKSNYTQVFLYFIKDKLLPRWRFETNPTSGKHIKSEDTDLLCLDWAAQRKIPFVTWEAHDLGVLCPEKSIPSEARKRGIDVVTPEELLHRTKFDESEAVRQFMANWDQHEAIYMRDNPQAGETLPIVGAFYRRLVADDRTHSPVV